MAKNLGLNYLYRKIFKEKASLEANDFITNLSWSFLGGFITSVVMFAVNIYIGRVIGPNEFGKYNLVLTISQLLLIPIMFSFELSSVRAIAKSINENEKKSIITTAIVFIILNLAVFSLLAITFTSQISARFNLEISVIYIVLLMTIITGLKQLLDSFVRGLQVFIKQFIGRILELSVSLTVLAYLVISSDKLDYLSYIIVITTGGVALILFYLIVLKKYFSKFDLKIFKNLFSYSKIILLGSVLGTAFNSLDKIIIAKYLSMAQLGVYSAYYMASTNLVAQLIQIFINVFFPTVSKSVSKVLIDKIDRLSKIIILPGTILFSVLVFLILKLFGNKYEMNYYYVLSFGFLAVIQFIFSIYSFLIMAVSKQIYKKFLIVANIINGIHLVVYGLLIYFDKVSIQAIVSIFTLNTIINILFQRKILKNSSI
ncbi:MAG: hypothetical protein UR93_C0036G0004 [Berkelbacteria bacterium GW2011_GWA2_35_9]|uniref:Polysaccharide biosynthesis protein n=1 Tax=Berkelbacteria bacterium GW2011_GWA2_35_9 TaxID=1618333 RepID=A0A0G0G7L7_9BACT|nr:MAG: hypothetical protein UR93_C0036G0004 [Berkelbacteria bacterium GW2011_GWA2_35_9]